MCLVRPLLSGRLLPGAGPPLASSAGQPRDCRPGPDAAGVTRTIKFAGGRRAGPPYSRTRQEPCTGRPAGGPRQQFGQASLSPAAALDEHERNGLAPGRPRRAYPSVPGRLRPAHCVRGRGEEHLEVSGLARKASNHHRLHGRAQVARTVANVRGGAFPSGTSRSRRPSWRPLISPVQGGAVRSGRRLRKGYDGRPGPLAAGLVSSCPGPPRPGVAARCAVGAGEERERSGPSCGQQIELGYAIRMAAHPEFTPGLPAWPDGWHHERRGGRGVAICRFRCRGAG